MSRNVLSRAHRHASISDGYLIDTGPKMRLGAEFAARLEMLNTSDLLNPFLQQREPREGQFSY